VPSQFEPSHYFSPAPDVASRRRTVDLVLPEGRLVHLATDRGTFSPDHVDAGTRLLLSTAPDPGTARTLIDLGCGYGPIAVTMALRAAPDATVWAVDVNERARALCAENAEANGVGDRVRVVAPDEVPSDLAVDLLWSNPPIRIGKAALHELLGGWLDRLSADGSAVLVVNRNLGADSLARWIEQGGRTTERLASRAGFRVLRVAPGRPEAAG
jgi:16S rRNA (guanine1207-N2)-methyltransferase